MLPYFQTDNTALALALAICGVPAPLDEAGNPIPQLMFYDRAILRRWGHEGMAMDAAALRAIQTRQAGKRVFQFQRTPDLERIVTAFKKAEDAERQGEPVEAGSLEVEDVARVVFMTNRLNRKMMSAFSEIPCFITEGNAQGEREKDGVSWKASGSFSAVGVRASMQLKSEVRV
jgi:hypothetical protein